MKKSVFFLFTAFIFYISTMAQDQIGPGANILQKSWIKNGSFVMGYYVDNNGQLNEICNFNIQIDYNSNSLSVFTALHFLNSTDVWTDTCISDATNFKPIYRSSYSSSRDYVIKYGKEINGYYFDRKTRKRNIINESVINEFFDSYTYPYLLGLLPLNIGYKADLPVYDYQPENTTNIKRARIEEVRNNIYKSNLTGEHKVWQVGVFEESTNDKYQYYIDKDTRRIWKIEVFSKGQHLVLLDKEVDFNPFTTRFDKEATMKMIKSGNSVISGQVFARDNQAGIKGIAILNVNKKQFARIGTSVVLIPNTDFFKEWVNLNKTSRKKGVSIPLPKDVLDCIKVATVYDEEGHFDFVNLMPGEYLLYTEFGYVHTATRTEVIGYTDTYINGMFQGSSANTQSYQYNTNAAAAVQKMVTIKKDGDKEIIKLKKTL